MVFASLASGSKGNCQVLYSDKGAVLVDAGISWTQIRKRMITHSLDPARVQGLMLSHEHSDHIAALPMILKHTDWRILATAGTRRACEVKLSIEIPDSRWVELEAGKRKIFESFSLDPFSIPHDAEDPVAFRIEQGGKVLVIVTDLGYPSALVMEYAQDADLLFLEANHDVDMLREGPYPPFLKARILGRLGHLSNMDMAQALDRLRSSRLKAVFLGHLSETNNHPDLARFTGEEVLRDNPSIALYLASQENPQLYRWS